MDKENGDSPAGRGATGRDKEDASLFERVVPEGFKRRLEAGVENVMRDRRLKALMGELTLPKEIVSHILGQIDETKHAALAVIARETRGFLERTNISEELAKLLTQVTFEIKTEVRFVPNDKAGKGGVLPKVKISGPTVKAADQKEEDGKDGKDGKLESDPEA